MYHVTVLDRTQHADVTGDPDDYVSRYAKIIGSHNNYSVFERDLPGTEIATFCNS